MHQNAHSHAMMECITRDATLTCATKFGNSYYKIKPHRLLLCKAGGADQHGFHPMTPGAGHGLPIYGTSRPPHRLPLCEAEGADQHGFYPMAPGPRRGLPIYGTSKPGSHERGLPNIGTSPFLGFSAHPPFVSQCINARGEGGMRLPQLLMLLPPLPTLR